MISTDLFLLYKLCAQDGRVHFLGKKKCIMGSDECCDIRIQSEGVSSYHCFLCIQDGGLLIKDLCSEMGVWINGERVREAVVVKGDEVQIGSTVFTVDVEEEECPVFNSDEQITPVVDRRVLIDGELCDIIFDENVKLALKSIPNLVFTGGYLDLDSTEDVYDIAVPVKSQRLEVVTYLNGLLLDVNYIKLNDGDYYLAPECRSNFEFPFFSVPKSKIFSLKKGKLSYHAIPNLVASGPWNEKTLSEGLLFTLGSEQISLRLVQDTVHWRGLPFLYRDRYFYTQAGKVFVTLFTPILLLLFVTLPEAIDSKPEPVVIYQLKKAPQPTPDELPSEVSSAEPSSVAENTGQKEELQPQEKVEFSEASQEKSVLAKSAAPEPPSAAPEAPTPSASVKPVAQPAAEVKVVNAPTPSVRPVAKTTESPVQVAPAAPAPVKPKPYQFRSTAAKSLVANTPDLNVQAQASKSISEASNFNSGSSADGELVVGSSFGVSKLNGSDKAGTKNRSWGSRGLAAKEGFDSSYIEPNTVVRGSMDPELLRKILREYIPQFRHCYQQELVHHSEKIKGTVELDFTINAQGRAARFAVKMKDAKFSPQGVKCMGSVLRVIDFPKPKGGGIVDVSQPLNFMSEKSHL